MTALWIAAAWPCATVLLGSAWALAGYRAKSRR